MEDTAMSEIERRSVSRMDAEKYIRKGQRTVEVGNYTYLVNPLFRIRDAENARDKMRKHILECSIRTFAHYKD
jgi:hypothetical protein